MGGALRVPPLDFSLFLPWIKQKGRRALRTPPFSLILLQS